MTILFILNEILVFTFNKNYLAIFMVNISLHCKDTCCVKSYKFTIFGSTFKIGISHIRNRTDITLKAQFC